MPWYHREFGVTEAALSRLLRTPMHKPHIQTPNQAARYFPGWTMLGIAAAAQYMSAPGQSYSVSVLKDSMKIAFGASETAYSMAYTFATVVSACLLPFVGRLVDRVGARIMLPAIAVGLGAACLSMSAVESLTGLYFSFAFVRSLGQGALSGVECHGDYRREQQGENGAIRGVIFEEGLDWLAWVVLCRS